MRHSPDLSIRLVLTVQLQLSASRRRATRNIKYKIAVNRRAKSVQPIRKVIDVLGSKIIDRLGLFRFQSISRIRCIRIGRTVHGHNFVGNELGLVQLVCSQGGICILAGSHVVFSKCGNETNSQQKHDKHRSKHSFSIAHACPLSYGCLHSMPRSAPRHREIREQQQLNPERPIRLKACCNSTIAKSLLQSHHGSAPNQARGGAC